MSDIRDMAVSDEELGAFKKAVFSLVLDGGKNALKDPSRFVSDLSDLAGPDSTPVKLMMAHCDEGVLSPFAEADWTDAASLAEASARSAQHLTYDLLANEAISFKTCGAIASVLAKIGGASSLPEPELTTEPAPTRGKDLHAEVSVSADQTFRNAQTRIDEPDEPDELLDGGGTPYENENALQPVETRIPISPSNGDVTPLSEMGAAEAGNSNRENQLAAKSIEEAKQQENKSPATIAIAVSVVAIVIFVGVLAAIAMNGQDTSKSSKTAQQSGGDTMILSPSAPIGGSDSTPDSERASSPSSEKISNTYVWSPVNSIFYDENAIWWGGKTNTGDNVILVENQNISKAGYVVFESGGAISWGEGKLKIKGSKTRIAGDDPIKLVITERTGSYLVLKSSDWGSGKLPALSEKTRETIRHSLERINNA